MARCSRECCRRWRPDVIIRLGELGLRVDGEWFCSRRDASKPTPSRRLRGIARRRDVDSPSARVAARRRAASSGCRHAPAARRGARSAAHNRAALGEQLQQLGHVTPRGRPARLAAQNGVSYLATVDPASVRTAPGGLSDRRSPRARHRAVPRKRRGAAGGVRRAGAARGDRRAAGADRAARSQPFLVADDDFDHARAGSYGASCDRPCAAIVGSRYLATGASRIAALAAEAGDVTVTEAHVDPFTWVRIAANGRVNTLLVPPYTEATKETRRMAGGYYTALSGMRTRMDALDRLASDIANASTAGYKTERAGTTQADRPSFGTTLQSAVDVANGEARTRSPPGRAGADRPAARRRDRRQRLLRGGDAAGRALHAQRSSGARRRRRAVNRRGRRRVRASTGRSRSATATSSSIRTARCATAAASPAS